MAVTSGFFNSLYGDRKYTAEQFSAIFDGVINDGVFSNVGTAFRVSATTDNNITIGIGRAWFNGIWVNNDALLPMTCNDPEVLLDRIDTVVIEINRSEAVRAGRIIFVRGTAAGSPVPPTLTHDEEVDQYPLAHIRRKAGVSAVVQADITNCIGTSECPYVTGILETQNIDNIVAQWESEFNIWFDGLQVELSGDVAANLASQIIELNAKFTELAENRTVSVELEDSSYEVIQDSDGKPIMGTTAFVSDGSGDSSTPIETEPKYEVGDIITTARTGLGVNWLLCNGAEVNRADYPDLSPLLPFGNDIGPFKTDEVFGLTDSSDTNATSIQYVTMLGVDYLNGYYVAWGFYADDTDLCHGVIAYKKNLSDEWTTKILWSGSGHAVVKKVIFENGNWIAIGGYGDDGSSHLGAATVGYTANIEGSWSISKPWTWSGGYASYRTCVNDILYRDGRFIIVGAYQYNSDSTYCYAYWATSPAGPWTNLDIAGTNDGDCGFIRIKYLNEQYVILSDGETSSGCYSYVYYCPGTSDPTVKSNWKNTGESSFLYRTVPHDIDYVDGQYVLLAYPGSNYVIRVVSKIGYDDMTSYVTWPLPSDSFYINEGSYNVPAVTIKHKLTISDDGLYIAGSSRSSITGNGVRTSSQAYIRARELFGNWDLVTMNPESSLYPHDSSLVDSNSLTNVFFIDGNIFLVGTRWKEKINGDKFLMTGQGCVICENSETMLLPELSSGNAYSYIKAGGD